MPRRRGTIRESSCFLGGTYLNAGCLREYRGDYTLIWVVGKEGNEVYTLGIVNLKVIYISNYRKISGMGNIGNKRRKYGQG